MERIEMKKVIGGKVYNTETAELVANDVYWDGSNFERQGRNTWLYRTPRGAFFSVHGTLWQGERDTLRPLTETEARELYESLPEQEVPYEKVFGEPEEPEPERGRPPLYGEAMKQTAVHLPVAQIAWLKEQPEGISETVRRLIDAAMMNDEGVKSMNQRTLANTAAEIVRFVRENGRVNQQEDGTEDPESLWAEVEFEASDRGYPSSEAIADYAKEHFC